MIAGSVWISLLSVPLQDSKEVVTEAVTGRMRLFH